MAVYVTLGQDLSKRRINYRRLIQRHMLGAKWKKREIEVQRLMRDPDGELKRYSGAAEKNIHNIGVECFSETNENLLMWSHYAQHHRGFVLQFDLAKDIQTLLRASKVEYLDKYPVWDVGEITHEDIRPVLLRKHPGWSYEQEWRIVVPNGARTSLKFKPDALMGLTFGCRADLDFKKRVRKILEIRASKSFPPLKIYEAVKHPREYKVTIQEDHSLIWPS